MSMRQIASKRGHRRTPRSKVRRDIWRCGLQTEYRLLLGGHTFALPYSCKLHRWKMRKSWNSLWAVCFLPVRIWRHREQWTQFRQRDHAYHRRTVALPRLILDWWILLPSEKSKEYEPVSFFLGGGVLIWNIALLLLNHCLVNSSKFIQNHVIYLSSFIASYVFSFLLQMYMFIKL